MRTRELKHLSDGELLRGYNELIARDLETTAEVLAFTAEVDLRRLYLPAGHPSMFMFCVQELHMSEDVAYLRIRAARTARRFPAIFEWVADGRLHLSGVALLAPYLTTECAAELLEAAAHKTRAEIRELLAARFPRPDLPAFVKPITGAPPMVQGELVSRGVDAGAPGPESALSSELVSKRVGDPVSGHAEFPGHQPVSDPVGASEFVSKPVPPTETASAGQLVSKPVAAPAQEWRLAPLAPGRFALQVTISRVTHDELRRAQALLSHRVPSGDLDAVLCLALEALNRQLEKQKFAATDTPRPRPSGGRSNPRHIPAHVKRAVWKRDGGQCTFVSETGRRCSARRFLEYDHIQPVARGGEATVAGIRLRCRMHNQYEAERVFGAGFMAAKREARRTCDEATAKIE